MASFSFNTSTGATTVGIAFRDVIDGLRFVRVFRGRSQEMAILELELYLANKRLLNLGHRLSQDPSFRQDLREHPIGPHLVGVQALILEAQELARHPAASEQPAVPQGQQLAIPAPLQPNDDTSTLVQRIVDGFVVGWEAMRGWAAPVLQDAWWVVYDRDHLKNLVDAIKSVVKALELAYPSNNNGATLLMPGEAALLDPNGLVHPQQALRMLAQAAQSVYPQLARAAQEEANALSQINVNARGRVTVTDRSRNFIGVQYDSADSMPPVIRAVNVTTHEDVTVSGDSVNGVGVNVGTALYDANPRAKWRSSTNHSARRP